MTTGLYPHELFLGFREEVRIAELKIVSSDGIKRRGRSIIFVAN